jgi:hypothetical protein
MMPVVVPSARHSATFTLILVCTVTAYICGLHLGSSGGGDILRGGSIHPSAAADGGPPPSHTLPDYFFIPITSRASLPADKIYTPHSPTRTPNMRTSQIPPAPFPSPPPSTPKHMPRVAVAFSGTVVWMERWRNLLNAMNETRKEIALFVSLWKEPPDEAQVASWRAEPNSSLTSVKYEPGGTWTTGRNLLLQTIYEEEVRRGKRFDYWIVADADAAFVECYRCPVTRLPDVTGAACCMDYFVALALNRAYNFSSISTILAREEYPPFEARKDSDVIDRTFQLRDCGDGQLQAYHRDYVPIVFPYHVELDAMSWWSSQGILFRFTSTCGPGANVLPGRNFRPNLMEHIDYPKWERDIGREEMLVRDTYPELADFPINAAVSPNLMCRLPSRAITLDDPTMPGQGVVDWRATESFKKCLRVKEPWFVRTTGKSVPQAPR